MNREFGISESRGTRDLGRFMNAIRENEEISRRDSGFL